MSAWPPTWSAAVEDSNVEASPAILIPAGYHAAFAGTVTEQEDVLAMSRATAVIVLTIYIAYMIFQLWSHSHLFVDAGDDSVMKTRRVGKHTMFREAKSMKRAQAAAGTVAGGAGAALDTSQTISDETENGAEEEEEEEEQPSINVGACVLLLLADAVLVGVTAEW